MTEKFIQEVLFNSLDKHRYPISNIFLYLWESDFFAIITRKKRDHAFEFEIKVTRQDFRKDEKYKIEKHRLYSCFKNKYMVLRGPEHQARPGIGSCCGVQFIERCVAIPNYLYYVCPTGIIPHDEVPHYAGLIEISESGKMKYVKLAPQLHAEKFVMWRQLLEKYYWQWKGQREKVLQLKLELDQIKKEENHE